MVTSARTVALPGLRPRQQAEAAPGAEAFIARARALGVDVSPLTITRPGRVFPWICANREFLRVSWERQRSLSLFGLLRVSWTQSGSGIFRQHDAAKVLMPVEGERIASTLKALPEVEEMAVLEERVIDPILAVRVAGQWFEAYRWWKAPVILPDDCPLVVAERDARQARARA